MSILLTAQNLEKSFGDRMLFSGLSFVVSERDRIGLIGPNGAGKSTLFKILTGDEAADDGEIIPTKALRMAYVPQTPNFEESQSIGDSLFPGEEDWAREQKLQESLWQYDIAPEDFQLEKSVSELSGGWKKRLAILAEVLKHPDLLLLDEPTNHLDIEGILWLEKLIRSSKFASVTITHDRYFLDKVSNRIFELDKRNENGVLNVEGNYSRYLHVKSAMMASQESREASLRGVLRRETEWLKAGVKARTTKQQARIQRQAELSKEVSELSKRNEKQKLSISFQSASEQPKRLLEAKKLKKSFEDSGILFADLDLLLTPGTCVGIIGENASGKSTLIKVLLGEEAPSGGHVFRSDLLNVAYFEQQKDQIDPKLSLLRTVCPYGDQVIYRGKPLHIRSYLGRFLFENEKMDLPVGSISGGEQSRMLLAKLMLVEANLLVLDEPTNDLDIPTLNVLEDCLSEFDGAVLLVTHDRYFLDRVSTQLIAFPPRSASIVSPKLQSFHSFDQWKDWFESFATETEDEPAPKPLRDRETRQPKKGSPPLKEQQRLMKRIEKLETDYAKLEDECSQESIQSDFEKLEKLGTRMEKIRAEIDEKYEAWSALEASN